MSAQSPGCPSCGANGKLVRPATVESLLNAKPLARSSRTAGFRFRSSFHCLGLKPPVDDVFICCLVGHGHRQELIQKEASFSFVDPDGAVGSCGNQLLSARMELDGIQSAAIDLCCGNLFDSPCVVGFDFFTFVFVPLSGLFGEDRFQFVGYCWIEFV